MVTPIIGSSTLIEYRSITLLLTACYCYYVLLVLCTSGYYARQAAELEVRASNHWTVVPEVFWGTEIGIELRNGVTLNY